MTITSPINFPTGDRYTVAVATPSVYRTVDPLYDADRDGSTLVVSVDTAIECARSALARNEDASIHDHGAMLQAASDLQTTLRMLVASLDAERAA
ncbi:hypothetical protein ACFUJR_00985 [Streptomyces sp. NPDC057271]|uniref:hypothetical protein n=1 Tax=unclassified Streptomyces TaxID=2593676 RepID=UPI0036259823